MAQAKVADLTIEELRRLIRDVVSESLHDIFDDPDQGLEIRDDMMARIQQSLSSMNGGAGKCSADDVAARLGLEW